MKYFLNTFFEVNIMISLPYLMHIKRFYNILLHIYLNLIWKSVSYHGVNMFLIIIVEKL
jgi:hypothetical protein